MYTGENGCFEAIYRKYFRALAIYAFDIVQEESLAQDAVQDVFGKLYTHPTTFSTDKVLRVYLYNAVRNRAISILRRQHTADAYSAKVQQAFAGTTDASAFRIPQSAFSDPEADDDFFTPEVMRQLAEAIDRLPDRQREILLMAMKGRKISEIAQQMQIATGTVKTQKQRAISKLRTMFDPKSSPSSGISMT